MRRKLIAGNWKMNGSLAALTELDAIAAAAIATPAVDVAIALPATLITPALPHARGFAVGAEDVHEAESGAHTGEISAAMMKEAGAVFTLVGHSERRCSQKETDAQVKAKAEAAHRAGLSVILCVGETLAQREGGHAVDVVTGQLAGSLPDWAGADWLTIAYEPIWAVGTGRPATPADAAAMHGAIRAELGRLMGGANEKMRILYGGSVTADNAAVLLATADVDGALIGGASLTAAQFVPIIAIGATIV